LSNAAASPGQSATPATKSFRSSKHGSSPTAPPDRTATHFEEAPPCADPTSSSTRKVPGSKTALSPSRRSRSPAQA
jgi:hypothetical protein